ncbi:tetratricopeptide repeat protein [Methanobrevibacter sp.]|uniref:tetratricopeptide repeat protein n=1 Tax=Methanobrevibacter sp. TaxID=66852 RepID=UPI0039761686
MKRAKVNAMTTNNHLNFEELDSKTYEDYSKTANELLEVEHLDFENSKYLAKVLFLLKRHDESIEQLERALSQKSDDESIALIAVNHFQKGDYENSLKFLDECLERDPENQTLLSYAMMSYEFQNDYENAVRCGKRILKCNSKNISVINRLIDCHIELENYEKCLDYISQIEYEDSYKKASILHKAGRYEECIEESRKIQTVKSYRLAGMSYHKLGNTVKAVKYLYKSYEKDPNIDTLFEIAEIYFEAGDYGRAIHFLNDALLHDPLSIEAHTKIAHAYLNTSHWDDAVEYAKKAIKISKKVPQAYIILAEAYFQLESGNVEKTLEVLDEGIGENPESEDLWMEKGGYSFPYDMFTFKESYEKAISLNPKNPDIYHEYIYLLIMNDELEAAKRYYNQMLFYNPLFEKSFEELKKSMYL